MGGAELFRKTLAYLGKVERREGTMLAFEMLLWVNEVSWPSSTGCHGAAVYKCSIGSFCAWGSDVQLLKHKKWLLGSQLCWLSTPAKLGSPIEHTLLYRFHHPHSGLRAVETTLAMTSINEFKGGTQWQKIEAEVQGMLWGVKWRDDQVAKHWFPLLLVASIWDHQCGGCQNITDDSRLVSDSRVWLSLLLMRSPYRDSWGKSPQVMVYMTREPGFGNWNFLEFTLGAVEGRMYGLEHAVNRHTVMQGWCQW